MDEIQEEMIEQDKVTKVYRRKTNPKRFFFPKEWNKFLMTITKEDHRFWFEVLLHTGARYNEIRDLLVRDIDFERESVTLKMGHVGKTGKNSQRTLQISTYLRNRILSFVRRNELGKLDTLHRKGDSKLPSIQYMDKAIKMYCKQAGIEDYQDFSCHNLRKTLENWLLGLNVNSLTIGAHMGHIISVAQAHYTATNTFNQEDRVLIRSILDNLLNK